MFELSRRYRQPAYGGPAMVACIRHGPVGIKAHWFGMLRPRCGVYSTFPSTATSSVRDALLS
jgi:hypothetical protein